MLTRRKDPLPDPEEEWIGKCGTCHSAVSIQVGQARRPPKERLVGRDPGGWNDLTCTECPQCKARVYLVPKNRL